MYILCCYVDMVEQVLMHEAVVGLQRISRHGVVLIQIEGGHMCKGQPLVPMLAHQLPVDLHGSGTSGQAQDTLLACNTHAYGEG